MYLSHRQNGELDKAVAQYKQLISFDGPERSEALFALSTIRG